jgi:hypothetical protein
MRLDNKINDERKPTAPFSDDYRFRLANHSNAHATAFYDRSALFILLRGLGRWKSYLRLYLWGRPCRSTTRYQGFGAMLPLKRFEGLVGGPVEGPKQIKD